MRSFPLKAGRLLAGVAAAGLALGCAAGPRSQPAAPQPALLPGAPLPEAQRSEALRAIASAGRIEGSRRPELGLHAPDFDALYRAAQWRPLWLRDGRPTRQAHALVAHLAKAGESGLRAEDYDAATLAKRLEAAGPKLPPPQQAQLDAALSAAALRNVSDLRVGRASPEFVPLRIEVGSRQLDLPQFVAELATADDTAGLLAAAEPPQPRYRALKQALARYRGLAADPANVPPPDPGRLRPGMRHAAVPALRRWLAALGDLPPQPPGSGGSDLYAGDVVEGVKRFQERHGLEADGIVGAGTARALQVPLSQRVRQLELALERWRWMPVSQATRSIVVNVPEFRLYATEPSGGRAGAGDALRMRVIVGKALETETPTFSGELEYLVFRPYWNVPYSIVSKEMLPKLRKDPGYLARERLEIVTGGGRVTTAVNAGTLAGLASGAYGLRQRPGPSNSLGLVKFIFPNEENVYLHGTPARGLFARQRRDFSHGCIRVEDPVALAEYALAALPGWSRDRIESAMNSGGTNQVDLAETIPVRIVYITASATPGGDVEFFEDLYGHDAELELRLAGAHSGAARPAAVPRYSWAGGASRYSPAGGASRFSSAGGSMRFSSTAGASGFSSMTGIAAARS